MGNFGKGHIRKCFVIWWSNRNYEKNEPETFCGTTEIMKELRIEQNLRKEKGGKRKFTQKVKKEKEKKQNKYLSSATTLKT